MTIIFDVFGYFVNLKLLGFVFKDETHEWFALTEFKGELLEHKLIFQLNRKAKKVGVNILLKDTPYGTISYLEFDTKTNMTHVQFLPLELRVDMENTFGLSEPK